MASFGEIGGTHFLVKEQGFSRTEVSKYAMVKAPDVTIRTAESCPELLFCYPR